MYTVTTPAQVAKAILALPKQDRLRILAAIQGLAQNARPIGCKKLVGRPGWRMRAGNYRIVYSIDDTANAIEIMRVAQRGQAYR